MTSALETTGLGKRFGRTWALRDCTLTLPVGRVAALVGPNGAGTTTLLQLAVGLLQPSTGQVRVFGRDPRARPLEVLSRVGFVAQDTPLDRGFSVADLLAYISTLTDEAERLFPRPYDTVLGLLLDVLAERMPCGEQAALLREVGHRWARSMPQDGRAPRARMLAAVAALHALGGLAKFEEQDGAVAIQGCRCPLAGVDADHPGACLLAATLVSDIKRHHRHPFRGPLRAGCAAPNAVSSTCTSRRLSEADAPPRLPPHGNVCLSHRVLLGNSQHTLPTTGKAYRMSDPLYQLLRPALETRLPARSAWPTPHWLNGLLAMLVVAGIVGVALVLLRRPPMSQLSPNTGSDTWVGGTPVTREADAGGLHIMLQVTPGPYFLGELLAANLSLRNDSHTTYTLAGPAKAGPCGAAVFVLMSGSSEPQYELPVATAHSCPPMRTTLTPGTTLTLHEFLPVSNTGEVTLQAGARFLHTVSGPDGSQRMTTGPSPLDGLWPSIKIAVAAATPSDRQITLQREGAQVQISAPAAARAHLYYLYTVTCHAVQGGTVLTGNFAWQPIDTTVVQQPNCGDYGSQVIQWAYAVSAPGYAIASWKVGP